MVSFYEDLPAVSTPARGVARLPINQSDRYLMDGPALVNVVYVALPPLPLTEKQPIRLVSFAAYDEELLRDKYNEALRIVGCLGASEVKAWTFRGASVSARAGVKAPGVGGFGIGGSKSDQWDVTYEAHGVGGLPVDPRPLRYPHEPGLDAACQAVIGNGASSVEIEIARQSQFSVEGDLAGQLKKVGFELGFSADRNRYSVFRIEAKFPDAKLLASIEATKAHPRKWGL